MKRNSIEDRNVAIFVMIINIFTFLTYLYSSGVTSLVILIRNSSVSILQLSLSFIAWYSLFNRIKKNPLQGLKPWFRYLLILIGFYLSYNFWFIRVLSVGFLSGRAIKEGNKKIHVTTTNIVVSGVNDEDGYQKSLKWKLDGTPGYVITTTTTKINMNTNDSPISGERVKNVTEHVVNQTEKKGATPKTPVIIKNLFPEDKYSNFFSNFFSNTSGNNNNNTYSNNNNNNKTMNNTSTKNSSIRYNDNYNNSNNDKNNYSNGTNYNGSKNVKFMDATNGDSNFDIDSIAVKHLPKASTPYQRGKMDTPSFDNDLDNEQYMNENECANEFNKENNINRDDNRTNAKIISEINNNNPIQNSDYSYNAKSSNINKMSSEVVVLAPAPAAAPTNIKIGKVVIKKRKVLGINKSVDHIFTEDIIELKRKNSENIMKSTEMIIEELKQLSEKPKQQIEITSTTTSTSVLPTKNDSIEAAPAPAPAATLQLPAISFGQTPTIQLPNIVGTQESAQSLMPPDMASNFSLPPVAAIPLNNTITPPTPNISITKKASNSPEGRPPPSPLKQDQIKFDGGGIAFNNPLISNPIASVNSDNDLPSLAANSNFVFNAAAPPFFPQNPKQNEPAPAQPTPAFSFGQKPSEPAPAQPTPAFSFGQKPSETNPAQSTATFLFGSQNPNESTSTFTFGSQKPVEAGIPLFNVGNTGITQKKRGVSKKK